MLTLTENARLGTFILDQKLGEGGMGEVWKGHVELVPKKHVAIKIIRPRFATDPEFRSRFQTEAVTMASLTNVPIVPLENFFEDSGHLVLVMPFIAGDTLDKHISRSPAGLSLSDIQRISHNVLTALDAAHSQGILHRDLKPQNILLTPAGEAFLMDFGIAKDLSSDAPGTTGTGMIIGTAEYMSPEQIRGAGSSDGRSDIYGFGCVLYQMATGQLPFRANNPGLPGQMELLRLHLEAPPVNPSQLNSAIAPGLEAVILRALAKDPGHRFHNCLELRDALTNLSASSDSPYPATMRQHGLNQQAPGNFTVPPATISRPGPASPRSSAVIPPSAKPLPFAKYIGLAAALSLAAAGGWWLVHERGQEPAIAKSTGGSPETKKDDLPQLPKPTGPSGPATTTPPIATPPVTIPTVSREAEAHYDEAKKIESTAIQVSDFCRALAVARKAKAANPANSKYSAFVQELEGSCK